MKKNMKFIFSILLLTFIFSGCGKQEETSVNINGEVEVSETTENTQNNTENSLPVYDYKNLPVSDKQSEKEFESYYKGLLSERNRICYDEIYNAAQNFQNELVLSKSISPETLRDIMDIIYLDTPELYMLEPSYEYDTDVNGTVYKLYLKYCISEKNFETYKNTFLESTIPLISALKNSKDQSSIELEIISRIENINYSVKLKEGFFEDYIGKHPEDSILTIIKKGTGSSIAMAKFFNYYCRKAGVNSTIILGEITDTNYANNIGLQLNEYKPLSEIYTEKVEGSHVCVDIDYSSFYAWNIIELNNEWYHVDIPFYIKAYSNMEIERIKLEKARMLLNVDDYTISQSRLFFVNEEILGLTPECNSKTFQSIYRQGDYILNYRRNERRVRNRCRVFVANRRYCGQNISVSGQN